eukprot:m.775054 g.775054  ORF g.775054 m.775054 type:complete len:361 (+) comp59107_c0_seq49:879-1961(+)
MLADFGADLELLQTRKTVMHVAAAHGRSSIVRRLLESPRFVSMLSKRDMFGFTPSANAVESGEVTCLEILLEAGADILACAPERFGSALHLAAGKGHAAMLKRLLDTDFLAKRIDSLNGGGDTAVLCAVRAGSIECFEMLREAGANTLLQGNLGWLPLHVACNEEHEEMLRHLLGLHVHRQLIDSLDDTGESPLVVAIRARSLSCIHLLLDAGADPCLVSKDGRTSLHHAAFMTKTQVFIRLLEVGSASMNAQDELGQTPLMSALLSSCIENVPVLLDAGADLSLRDRVRVLLPVATSILVHSAPDSSITELPSVFLHHRTETPSYIKQRGCSWSLSCRFCSKPRRSISTCKMRRDIRRS